MASNHQGTFTAIWHAEIKMCKIVVDPPYERKEFQLQYVYKVSAAVADQIFIIWPTKQINHMKLILKNISNKLLRFMAKFFRVTHLKKCEKN